MSRGPGKIERAIRDLMSERPDGAWTILDLCELVYQGAKRIKKKHRVSVLRTLHRIVENDPDWQFYRSVSMGKTLVVFNMANVTSFALGREKVDFCNRYRNPDPRARFDRKATEDELLKEIRAGRWKETCAPGGAWWRHVWLHIAERDGETDTEEYKTLKEEAEEAHRQLRQMLSVASELVSRGR